MEIKSFVGENANSQTGSIVYKDGKKAKEISEEFLKSTTFIFGQESKLTKEAILETAKGVLDNQELARAGSILNINHMFEKISTFLFFYTNKDEYINVVNKLNYDLAWLNYQLKGFDVNKENKAAVNQSGNYYDVKTLEIILRDETFNVFKRVIGEGAGDATVEKINRENNTSYTFDDFWLIYRNPELYKKYIEKLHFYINELQDERFRKYLLVFPSNAFAYKHELNLLNKSKHVLSIEEICDKAVAAFGVNLSKRDCMQLAEYSQRLNEVISGSSNRYVREIYGLDIVKFYDYEFQIAQELLNAKYRIAFIDMVLKSLTAKKVLFAPIHYAKVNIKTLDISEDIYVDLIEKKMLRAEVFEKAKALQIEIQNRVNDILAGLNVEYL